MLNEKKFKNFLLKIAFCFSFGLAIIHAESLDVLYYIAICLICVICMED